MTIYNLYLDTRYEDAQLKVRLTTGGRGNRKTTLIPTGIYIDPKQWDDKRKRDRKNNAVNTRIFSLCGEIDKYRGKIWILQTMGNCKLEKQGKWI